MTKLEFAVIREDARLEGDLVMRTGAKSLLCVASGGCVALSLAARFPDLEVVAFDESQAQLDHLKLKAHAAEKRMLARLNVEDASKHGLNQCGEFEKVLRLLRAFFEEFIAPHDELLAFFTRSRPTVVLDGMVRSWLSSRYWRAAFASCFTDELLEESLHPKRLRHAAKGSFPLYFERAFARGFRRDGAPENPFLQHVFLGGYRRGCEPRYIRGPNALNVATMHGTLFDIPGLERFDVVSLSNVFDARSDATVSAWAATLKEKLKPGATILIRQMNNERRLRPFFEPEFAFNTSLGRSYFYRDRSLFYERFEVGARA
jgi:S-adenosylmethionine-diacylglycerol 3-amino-3-carboxypropyl transferase